MRTVELNKTKLDKTLHEKKIVEIYLMNIGTKNPEQILTNQIQYKKRVIIMATWDLYKKFKTTLQISINIIHYILVK